MKKVTIARFVMGMAAIFAAGCSAETGQGPSEEVGESSAALTTSSVVASNAMIDGSSVAAPREFASSCKITAPNGHEYLLVVGGLSASATPTRSYFLYDPTGTPQWITAAAGQFGSAGDEVAEGTMLVDPASSSRCVFVGGDNAGTSAAKIWEFTVSNTPAITALQQGTLNDARKAPSLTSCNGNKILITGGYKSAAADGLDTLEVYDPSARNAGGQTTTINFLKNSNASPAQVKLNDKRYDLAVAREGDHILVPGGKNAGTGDLDTVEGLVLDASDCKLASSSATKATRFKLTGTANTSVLSVARSQLAAFYDTGASKFIVAAGKAGSTAKQTVDTLSSLNWSTFEVTVASANSVPTAVARPLFVPIDGTRFVFVGGGNPGTAINTDQEYSAGTWTSTTVYSGGAALPARLGATGVYINSAVYAVGGIDGSSTFLNSMDKIGPTGL